MTCIIITLMMTAGRFVTLLFLSVDFFFLGCIFGSLHSLAGNGIWDICIWADCFDGLGLAMRIGRRLGMGENKAQSFHREMNGRYFGISRLWSGFLIRNHGAVSFSLQDALFPALPNVLRLRT